MSEKLIRCRFEYLDQYYLGRGMKWVWLPEKLFITKGRKDDVI